MHASSLLRTVSRALLFSPMIVVCVAAPGAATPGFAPAFTVGEGQSTPTSPVPTVPDQDNPDERKPGHQRLLHVKVDYPGTWTPSKEEKLDLQLIRFPASDPNAEPSFVSAQVVQNITNFPFMVEMPYRSDLSEGEMWSLKVRLTTPRGTRAATAKPVVVVQEGKVLDRVTVPLVLIPVPPKP